MRRFNKLRFQLSGTYKPHFFGFFGTYGDFCIASDLSDQHMVILIFDKTVGKHTAIDKFTDFLKFCPDSEFFKKAVVCVLENIACRVTAAGISPKAARMIFFCGTLLKKYISVLVGQKDGKRTVKNAFFVCFKLFDKTPRLVKHTDGKNRLETVAHLSSVTA